MTTSAFAAMLAAHAAQAAPSALVAGLTKLAISGVSASGATATTTTAATTTAFGGGILAKVAVAVAALTVPMLGYFTLRIGETAVSPTPAFAANEVRANAETQPEAEIGLAAAVDDNAEEQNGIAVNGVVLSETGYPRGGVEIFPVNDAFNHQRTDDPAFDGKFVIKNVEPEEDQWFAVSRGTHRATFFTLPSVDRDHSIDVTLDAYETTVQGFVFTPAGDPVAKASIALRAVTADGEEYILHTNGSVYTDPNGFFDIGRIPSGNGIALQAGVVPPGDQVPTDWTKAVTPRNGAWTVRLPDMVVPVSLAAKVAESKVPERYENVDREKRVPHGGVVRDEAGRPVDGALVEILWDVKPGFFDLAYAVTGADGRWTALAPEQVLRADVRITHPEFVPTRLMEDWIDPPLDRLQDQSSEIVLERGQPARGIVRDESGAPVPDVLVLTHRLYGSATTGAGNIPNENYSVVRTDAAGLFEIHCLAPDPPPLLLTKAYYSPVIAPIEPGGTAPFQITMPRGGTVTGRVVDADGQPIEGAGFDGDMWELDDRYRIIPIFDRTDRQGRFTLRGIPTNGVPSISVGKRGYIRVNVSTLKPRDEPYTLTLHKPLVVSGRVVDAETGEPITDFTVNGGWGGSGSYYFDRMGRASKIHHPRGEFKKRITGFINTYGTEMLFAVRVHADGYYAAQSEGIPIDATDEVEVRLQPGAPWTGRVTGIDGELATEVGVYFIAPHEQAAILNGLVNFQYTDAPEVSGKTDANGRFELPPNTVDGALLAISKDGYAYTDAAAFQRGGELTLTPWARVEGRIVLEGGADEAARVAMQPVEDRASEETPLLRWYFHTSSQDGRFEFDYVPAIPLEVGQMVVAARTVELSHSAFLIPQPGENHIVQVGGEGITIEGSIDLGKNEFLREQLAPKHVHAVAVRRSAGTSAPEGYRPRYVPQFFNDGTFRLTGLQPGEYDLSVDLHAPPVPNVCGAGLRLAGAQVRFTVPDPAAASITLAPVPLEPLATRPEPGDAAPILESFDLDGEPFYLDKLEGKFVVLDFWASWCYPCREQMPELQQLWQEFGKTPDVVFVGVNFDRTPEQARTFAQNLGVSWTHVHVGGWDADNPILRDFAVTAIPSLWLIGPDGNVIGRDLSVGDLRKELNEMQGSLKRARN